MRRGLVVVVLIGLGSVLSVGSMPAVATSCAGPSLQVEPGQLLLSGTRVTGDTFYDGGCPESVMCWEGSGCGGPDCDDVTPPAVPAEDVVLSLVQGDRTWRLGVTDADDEDRVAWTVTLPDDVRPGRARLVTDQYGAAVRVRVR